MVKHWLNTDETLVMERSSITSARFGGGLSQNADTLKGGSGRVET